MSAAIERDLEACRALLARGSKSFAFASRALPYRLRDPVAAFYAFCRVSDDAVDESDDPRAALVALHTRLDAAYAGTPHDDPVDRALAWLAHVHGLPRGPLEALLEGYLWDVERRTYDELAGTIAYSARVASSVGVAMTALMGRRGPRTLARAADLGVAMQLTNISRDVGEDARNGRLYLPRTWMREEGVDPDRFIGAPTFSPGLGRVVRRLLDEADVLYARAEVGIADLPADCRLAIRAASRIYRDIGRVIRARGCDSVSARAHTTGARKALLLARATVVAGGSGSDDAPLAETRFLVDAAAA
ncbi:phytoene/squalene synthase family protein [Sandaracinus amylolyticus]|uniref:phytoene/squalene synthase family protein n=1 Tax=Sandaracinus amylolyticus TaxID=927083 RepID=UPI001F33E131|nr:phytoene/squalene synthase family protein [Sandaracinus amylolyticus]UJR85079.1 Hypothetical protein I5071_71580 [Sandaracinus amylolyticus]